MLQASVPLFLLRELPFSRFDFSRVQTAFAITLLGILVALDPAMRAGAPNMPPTPLWLALLVSLASVWVVFLVIVGILRWWMKRGGRWDGKGDLFNLVAASWLVADGLGAGLVALGVPSLLVIPLWIYSVWVGANALSSAIPKASLGYSIAGIVIGLVPAILVSGVVMGIIAMAAGRMAA